MNGNLLEVKEATKEPTGFPNRVDSEISFDNLTRTFSVGPKAPATHFLIFLLKVSHIDLQRHKV
jgi:hypothetical protein